MVLIAWMVVLLLGLALLGWVCDRWPIPDQRSVDTHATFLRDLGGDRG